MTPVHETPASILEQAKALFAEERAIHRLDGWFLAREIAMRAHLDTPAESAVLQAGHALKRIVEQLPLSLSENAVFAGTQRDAFAKSYALINPNFRVSTFNGYCDPTAVFNDIEPNAEFPAERIERVREWSKTTPYVTQLSRVYAAVERDTAEVAYFVEQVTGHLIPDFRPALRTGLEPMLAALDARLAVEADPGKRNQCAAMRLALEAVLTLADRYAQLARAQYTLADAPRRAQLAELISILETAPRHGAHSLRAAIQVYVLLWQTMCLEQAPNPFAFSVGNADRIFEPYRAMEALSREETAALLAHFLVFFNVGDRSWAISQNILIGGRDVQGNDLTNPTSYALLDAYFAMNMPQPILSVKLHAHTPDALYAEMGRFFFSPGVLTPSLFNDDALFPVLAAHGVREEDLPDYAVAGCQEPLIMGRDNGNTTNSWLNLGKILELTLTGGRSLITGETLGDDIADGMPAEARLRALRTLFYRNVERYAARMAQAANGASLALSNLPVPLLSAFMGGMETAVDVRDPKQQGTRYNGSGCLIHGLSVVADSLIAVDRLLAERPQDAQRLLDALRDNFDGADGLRAFLSAAPKFGNNIDAVDREAAEVAARVSDTVAGLRNYLGNPFRPDWSTPSTHLLYGYWVGATPDGRKARDMLGYGVDPLYGEAQNGLGLRVLSARKLPYARFNGGYASHLGLDPAYFRGATMEDKGLEFRRKIMNPLFYSMEPGQVAPFYLYLNVTTPDMLRAVLRQPKKYAPNGVYIMRIHGTFVNFLDLSPEIQQDIITRLDLQSTAC